MPLKNPVGLRQLAWRAYQVARNAGYASQKGKAALALGQKLQALAVDQERRAK